MFLGRRNGAARWLRARLSRQHRAWFRSHRRAIRRIVRGRDRKLTYDLPRRPGDRPYWYTE